MAAHPRHEPQQRHPELTEREGRVLAALVRAYIERGEPVSSLWLARKGFFGLSSATMRNILAGLEHLGYVRQPHTSAGRIPTDRGYRYYVDTIMQSWRSSKPASDVEERLRHSGTVDDVLADASQELSRASQHLGFALAGPAAVTTLHRIDFVSLDATKVLVVVIGGGGQISHKVVELQETIAPEDLAKAAGYLNTEMTGLPLDEVRRLLEERLQRDRSLYDALLNRALRFFSTTLEDICPVSPIFIQGASSLLAGGLTDEERIPLATLRALFAMIEEKHRLVRLLGEYIDGPGLTVVIGNEHASPDLRSFSLVAATFVDRCGTGTIGVIGPTRMHYSRTIATVDSLSRTVSRVLLDQ